MKIFPGYRISKIFSGIAIISLIGSCSSGQDMNTEFDKNVIEKIRNFNYTVTEVSGASFLALKDSIIRSQPLPAIFTPASLGAYINTAKPSISDVLSKYKDLYPLFKLQFIVDEGDAITV